MEIEDRDSTSKSNTSKTLIALIVGLVVGFGLSWLVFARPDGLRSGQQADEKEFGVSTTTTDVPALRGEVPSLNEPEVFVEEEIVEVKDQVSGGTVFISRVSLRQPGWVVIRDLTDDGLGNVLGAGRFESGVYQGTIKLLRATEDGGRYTAVLWKDNGDRVFDLESDIPITSFNGEVIAVSFEAY